MNNLSATYKGLITGALMILVSLGIYFLKKDFDNVLQYVTYSIYIGGILWTLFAYRQSGDEPKNFKNYFSQGFRCFIVVTLLMVAFTWIFLKMNPGLRDEMAQHYRADLESKKNYTPAEIDNMVNTAKEYFVAMLTSMAIFGYLIIGALVTLIGAGFLSQKKAA